MATLLSDLYLYNTNRIFTDLFDGFFIFTAIIVIMIILGCCIPRYKKTPTARKRNTVKKLTISLNIISAFFLLLKINILSFLFNPYTYLTTSKFDISNIEDPAAQMTYIIVYAVYIVSLIASVVICVMGYRAICDKNLTQTAYRQHNIIAPANPQFKACAVCGIIVPQHSRRCPRCSSEEFISSANQPLPEKKESIVCPSCNIANPGNASFCHRCGNKLN